MPKQIIILKADTSSGVLAVTYCLWVPVTTIAAQSGYFKPTLTSAYAFANTAELAALRSGSVVEFVNTFMAPLTYTNAQMKTELIRNYSIQFTQLNSTTAQYVSFGVSYDGTVWSA